jgi:hypothetical protein
MLFKTDEVMHHTAKCSSLPISYSRAAVRIATAARKEVAFLLFQPLYILRVLTDVILEHRRKLQDLPRGDFMARLKRLFST